MRTVRNIVNTGRTIVCTIHQPSIDIFESFDELLLLKRGGETIFNGQLGVNSDHLIEYFQASILLSCRLFFRILTSLHNTSLFCWLCSCQLPCATVCSPVQNQTKAGLLLYSCSCAVSVSPLSQGQKRQVSQIGMC